MRATQNQELPMTLSDQQQPDTQTVTPRIEFALPTGLPLLDSHLEGGLYPGSIVTLTADPASQSEVLLAHLTNNRNTLYLSLQRTPESVRSTLSRSGADMSKIAVRFIGPENALDEMCNLITTVEERANVVIDPVNAIERLSPHRLTSFFNAVQAHLISTSGLLVLHSLNGDDTSSNRGLTEYMSDVIFQLETEYFGDTVDNRLLVSKNRGGKPFPHAIKLQLTDKVAVDTSREIA